MKVLSPRRCARRKKKLGLSPDFVEIAGVLDTYQTGTGFLILPVVGFVRPGFNLTPDKNEVADIFEVPAHIALAEDSYKTDAKASGKGACGTFIRSTIRAIIFGVPQQAC